MCFFFRCVSISSRFSNKYAQCNLRIILSVISSYQSSFQVSVLYLCEEFTVMSVVSYLSTPSSSFFSTFFFFYFFTFFFIFFLLSSSVSAWCFSIETSIFHVVKTKLFSSNAIVIRKMSIYSMFLTLSLCLLISLPKTNVY